MAIEETLKELKTVLDKIETEELAEYLKSQEMDDFSKNAFIINYVYGRRGTEKGLIPVLRTIMDWCPVGSIPEEKLRERLRNAETDRLTKTEEIEKINAEIEKVSASITAAKETEKKLNDSLASLNALKLSDEEAKKRIEELKELIKEAGQYSDPIDNDIQTEMGQILDMTEGLANYEKFLSACVKARKMTDRDKGGKESDDAKVIHEFLLIKWFLNYRNPKYTDAAFEKTYGELLKDMDDITERGKVFFKEFMDATDRESNLPE